MAMPIKHDDGMDFITNSLNQFSISGPEENLKRAQNHVENEKLNLAESRALKSTIGAWTNMAGKDTPQTILEAKTSIDEIIDKHIVNLNACEEKAELLEDIRNKGGIPLPFISPGHHQATFDTNCLQKAVPPITDKSPDDDFRAMFTKLHYYGEMKRFSEQNYKQALHFTLRDSYYDALQECDKNASLEQIYKHLSDRFLGEDYLVQMQNKIKNFKRDENETIRKAINRFKGQLNKAEILQPKERREAWKHMEIEDAIIKMSKPEAKLAIKRYQATNPSVEALLENDDLLRLAENAEKMAKLKEEFEAKPAINVSEPEANAIAMDTTRHILKAKRPSEKNHKKNWDSRPPRHKPSNNDQREKTNFNPSRGRGYPKRGFRGYPPRGHHTYGPPRSYRSYGPPRGNYRGPPKWYQNGPPRMHQYGPPRGYYPNGPQREYHENGPRFHYPPDHPQFEQTLKFPQNGNKSITQTFDGNNYLN